MHDFLVENELYATGPTLFTAVETTEKDVFDYNVYLPLNTVVTLPENSVFSFMETFHIMDGLMMRHCDVEDPLEPSNYLLKACADQNHLQLDEPFINIFLDVYGDGVIEIFAPIKQVSK